MKQSVLGLLLLFYGVVLMGQDHFTAEFFENQEFAHKGGGQPENALSTIVRSIHNGINAIEIDIRMTADSQLVVFHDDSLHNVCISNKTDLIHNLSYAEVCQHPLKGTQDKPESVTLFRNLVDTLIKLVPEKKIDFILELDFKPHGDWGTAAIDELVNIVHEQTAIYGEGIYNYFFVSCFYPDVLKKLEKQDPKIIKAFSINTTPVESKFAAKMAAMLAPRIVKKYNAKILDVNYTRLTERYIRRWHRRGVFLNAYTVNKACEKKQLKAWGVAYTTNCPATNEDCATHKADQMKLNKRWKKKCK